MAFFSLLNSRRIFKEVMVGFLNVGHIHEVMDAHFNYLLKLLKMRNTYVLVDLMKAFMDSHKIVLFIPKVVLEVVDFKKYVKNFHHDGANSLSRLGDMHLFKFFVEEDGNDCKWPVMRYKVPLNSKVKNDCSLSLVLCTCIGVPNALELLLLCIFFWKDLVTDYIQVLNT
jgi:hypothetical protein